MHESTLLLTSILERFSVKTETDCKRTNRPSNETAGLSDYFMDYYGIQQ